MATALFQVLAQIKQTEPRSDSGSYTAPVAPQKPPLGPIPIYMIQAKCLKQKIDRRNLFVVVNAAKEGFERLAADRLGDANGDISDPNEISRAPALAEMVSAITSDITLVQLTG